MKKYLLALMLLFGAGSTALPALATPLVTEGSSYSVYLTGSEPTTPELFAKTFFDGLTGFVSYGATGVASIMESQVLDNGTNRINVTLNLSENLFQATDEQAIFAIGIDGDGFDFADLVSLDYASISLFDSTGTVLAVLDNLQNEVAQNRPWDGLFPAVNNAFFIEGFDATRVASVNVNFLVSDYNPSGEVPEPGSVLLCGIGLLAGIAATRRRRRA